MGVRYLNVNSTARTVEGLHAHGPRQGLSLSEPGFGMGAWEARRPAQKQRLLCAVGQNSLGQAQQGAGPKHTLADAPALTRCLLPVLP